MLLDNGIPQVLDTCGRSVQNPSGEWRLIGPPITLLPVRNFVDESTRFSCIYRRMSRVAMSGSFCQVLGAINMLGCTCASIVSNEINTGKRHTA